MNPKKFTENKKAQNTSYGIMVPKEVFLLWQKKGQKFKSYSEEVKAEVLKKYLEEYIPSSRLEEEYGIPQNTIRNWAIIYLLSLTFMIEKSLRIRFRNATTLN